MEDEEGVNRLTQYNEVCENDPQFERYQTILGEKPSIQGASEPTDIIWENRHFTSNQRNSRSCAVVLIMIVLLFISGAIIFLFSKTASAAIQKYPIVDCKQVYSDYNIASSFKKSALDEWNLNTKLEAKGVKTEYVGVMQCWCKKQKSSSITVDYNGK
jgi:hypothetical protein